VSGTYTCSVALSSGANTITVLATDVAGNTASQSVTVTYSSAPTISGFSPASGAEGAGITVTGSNFISNGLSPEVTLTQQGGGTIVAPISSVTAGSLSFIIPAGAATGPITVTVNGQSVTSSSSLTVASSSSFTLTAGPSAVSLLPGQSATVQVSLASTNGFTQLASLSVAGVPSGVTATFHPPQITEGGFSLLTLSAPSGQGASSSALTISASTTVQGISQTQTAIVALNVQALSGSATFAGQVAVTGPYNTPLVGVTVSFTGTNYTGAQTGCTGSTTTDAGGNFLLNGLSSSCTGSQMIRYDPSTVTSPPGKYSGVNLSYVLTPGQVTTPGIIVHLPNVTNAETFTISQNSPSNQTFVSQSIPGVTITIYAGTTFLLADGTQPDPFPLGIIEIPYNQIPDYMPPNPTEDPVFAMSIEPFNSSSSQPIAVTYPNRKNTLPGTDMPLTSLNPTLGMMVNYGTGSVSPDGTQVIPDPDPANPGHLYGITHFDWHFPLPQPSPNNPSPDPNCPCAGDPVDFGSGILVETKTDIAFGSALGQIAFARTYREMATTTGPAGIGTNGPFGLGTNHNYNYSLDTSFVSTVSPGALSVVGLLTPDGNEFWFSGQVGGTFTTSSIPTVAGATISNIQCNSFNGYGIPCSGTLRWKDGTIYKFQPLLEGQPWVGFLMSITDPNGNTTTIVHDQGVPSEIDQIVDPAGRALTLRYDGTLRIVSITDPISRSVSYTYNSIGKLATVTDPKGGVTTYTYNSQNQLFTIADALGNTYQNLYDPNGRVIQQTAPDGGVTQYAYTLLNPLVPTSPVSVTTVTDPRLNTSTYYFNPAGFLESLTDAMGNQTVYNINPATNQRMSVTDPLQRTTAYTYDSAGNTSSVTLLEAVPSGESVGGGSADVVGPTTTSYIYDPTYNKLTSATDPLGNVTTYGYDGHGNLLSVKDPLGRQTSYGYDPFGEKVSSTDPLGNVMQYSYSNGFVSSVTDPLGRVSSYVSDGIGRRIALTTPLGQTTQYQYDPLNKLASTTDAAGNRISDAYDLNENLLSVTDPAGNATKFSYDSMNRLSTRTDALAHIETYHHDFNGNLTQFTDRRGTVTNYTYDVLNRKMSANYGSGGGSVNYSYDSVNRLAQAIDSMTGPVSRNYDLLDRMVLENAANGSVSYAYDATGRRISMQVSGQPTVAYTYDADNELTRMMQNSSVITFAYDADGRRTTLTLPNGVATNYAYDAASELTADSYQLGSTTLGNLTYGYDADGRRAAVGGSFARTGLPAAASAGPYDANNQVTQWGGSNLTYDANGNLTSDGVNSYTWDARNRLVAISGGVSASFKYDPFGRRVSKTIGVTTTSYVYDRTNSVQELVGGSPSANMLDGLGMDEYFQRTDGSGTGDFLRDALGGTVALVGGGGSTIAQYTYEPFGNTTSTGASTNSNQYTGRENDGTGLYYYRARYYDPKIGRFISEDPSGFAAGINLYSYVGNSPLNFADPSGMCPPPNPCSPTGKAPSPTDYEAKGLIVQVMETSGYPPEAAAGVALNLYNLASFHRGGSLDAQAAGGSTAYANYAFGDYMSAAGFSLSETLAAANAYAAGFSNYGPTIPMDPNYPSLPAANVANITKGFNDEQNGTLCSPAS
jgi:RHS repeat-associated protein